MQMIHSKESLRLKGIVLAQSIQEIIPTESRIQEIVPPESLQSNKIPKSKF